LGVRIRSASVEVTKTLIVLCYNTQRWSNCCNLFYGILVGSVILQFVQTFHKQPKKLIFIKWYFIDSIFHYLCKTIQLSS